MLTNAATIEYIEGYRLCRATKCKYYYDARVWYDAETFCVAFKLVKNNAHYLTVTDGLNRLFTITFVYEPACPTHNNDNISYY